MSYTIKLPEGYEGPEHNLTSAAQEQAASMVTSSSPVSSGDALSSAPPLSDTLSFASDNRDERYNRHQKKHRQAANNDGESYASSDNGEKRGHHLEDKAIVVKTASKPFNPPKGPASMRLPSQPARMMHPNEVATKTNSNPRFASQDIRQEPGYPHVGYGVGNVASQFDRVEAVNRGTTSSIQVSLEHFERIMARLDLLEENQTSMLGKINTMEVDIRVLLAHNREKDAEKQEMAGQVRDLQTLVASYGRGGGNSQQPQAFSPRDMGFGGGNLQARSMGTHPAAIRKSGYHSQAPAPVRPFEGFGLNPRNQMGRPMRTPVPETTAHFTQDIAEPSAISHLMSPMNGLTTVASSAGAKDIAGDAASNKDNEQKKRAHSTQQMVSESSTATTENISEYHSTVDLIDFEVVAPEPVTGTGASTEALAVPKVFQELSTALTTNELPNEPTAAELEERSKNYLLFGEGSPGNAVEDPLITAIKQSGKRGLANSKYAISDEAFEENKKEYQEPNSGKKFYWADDAEEDDERAGEDQPRAKGSWKGKGRNYGVPFKGRGQKKF